MDGWHPSVGVGLGEGMYRWQQVKKPCIMRDSWYRADTFISHILSPLPTVLHAEDAFLLSDAKGSQCITLLHLVAFCYDYNIYTGD